MSFIETLFRDKAKKEVLFPRTKIKAVSDDNGKGLDAILDEMKVQVPDNIACVNDILPNPEVVPVNADTLQGHDAAYFENLPIKMDLLWENASTTSSFSAQTVAVEERYPVYIIFYIFKARTHDLFYSSVLIKNDGRYNMPYSGNLINRRDVSVQGLAFEFSDGYSVNSYNASASMDNTLCVPTAIYGIK